MKIGKINRQSIGISGFTSVLSAIYTPPIELYIAGTIPNKVNEMSDAAEQPEVFPEPEESPALQNAQPESSPGEIYVEPDSPMRQNSIAPNQPTIRQRTIVLQICPETGLIAVQSCPHPRPKTFNAGEEPREFCKPEYHNQRGRGTPQNSRTFSPDNFSPQ